LRTYAALQSALRFAGVIFAAVLFGGLLGPLINWLFKGAVRFEWRLFLTLAPIFALVSFVFIFVSEWVDSRAQHLRAGVENPAFSGSTIFRGMYGGGAIFFLIIMIGMYREGDSFWMQLILALLMALPWYCWPRAIRFSSEGLTQKTLWGTTQRLSFRAVENVAYLRAEGRTVVVGDGIEIVDTAQHVDRFRFHQLIEERTGKAVYGT
jgi:hypothetical protein